MLPFLIYTWAIFDGAILPTAGLDEAITVFYKNGTYATFVKQTGGGVNLPDGGTYTYNPTTGALTMLKADGVSLYMSGIVSGNVLNVFGHGNALVASAT